MNLKEKIAQAVAIKKELTEKYQSVTSVWFEFMDIPLNEIEERAKEVNDTPDIVRRNEADVLRIQAHDKHSSGVTIFAYSVPVKKISAAYITEVEPEHIHA